MDGNHVSYEWVESLLHLEQVARILGQTPVIGVDLEGDSMYHYFEKICLLQIATELNSYVIDPLSVRDFSPLKPVFSDPRIRKVFHGADYDIRSLSRDFKIEIENLFDTQLACRFLGLKETGLEAVLKSRFQVDLNKKFQRADWSQRPISPEMAEYAAMDTLYLIPLARLLEKELLERDRLSWVEEECRLLRLVRPTPPGREPLFLKVKGAFRLDPRSLTVLEALLQLRKSRAERTDRPPFKVMSNESLQTLALQKPLTLELLEESKVLSPKQITRYGQDLIQEIHRAMAIPEEGLLAYPRGARPAMTTSLRKRVAALKTWRDGRMQDLGLEPGVLLNNSLIQALALKNPRSAIELEEITGLKKWQRDHFGQEILQVFAKNQKTPPAEDPAAQETVKSDG
jgi:ribonuclease D